MSEKINLDKCGGRGWRKAVYILYPILQCNLENAQSPTWSRLLYAVSIIFWSSFASFETGIYKFWTLEEYLKIL